jgi:outer membrane murein-binding lipoprotein Lpp
MTKPRNGSRSTPRQVAGLLAVAALIAAGTAAVLLDRGDLALAALVVANGLVLAVLLRLHRRAARSGDVGSLAAQVRELGEGVARLGQEVDALRERAEFSDQRLLAVVEKERFAAEERHRELLRSLGRSGHDDAAPPEDQVRGVR